MCDCLKEITAKLDGHFQPKLTGPIESIKFDNEAYFLSSRNDVTGYAINNPVTIRYRHTAKNGNVTSKKLATFVRSTFCPFCGEKQV